MARLHHMYVVACADATLYTGYATDVAARVATHNAGRGAKYTKARRPVTLVATATFFTKQRAMSAEYHFKQLTRAEKDAVLACARTRPLEEVLAKGCPEEGIAAVLPPEPIGEFVARTLGAHEEAGYAAFVKKLNPVVDERRILGVRTPELRRLAKQLAKRPDVEGFLSALPHVTFEEDQLHAFVMAAVRDEDAYLAHLRAFLPYVDNWATCDALATKQLAITPERGLACVEEWLASEAPYTVRYAFRVLMAEYLDDLFDEGQLAYAASSEPVRFAGYRDPSHVEMASDAYYVSMVRAWYVAEALAKQPEVAFAWLAEGHLDPWTHNKAIQKAIESRRIPDETKKRLRTLKVRSRS